MQIGVKSFSLCAKEVYLQPKRNGSEIKIFFWGKISGSLYYIGMSYETIYFSCDDLLRKNNYARKKHIDRNN